MGDVEGQLSFLGAGLNLRTSGRVRSRCRARKTLGDDGRVDRLPRPRSWESRRRSPARVAVLRRRGRRGSALRGSAASYKGSAREARWHRKGRHSHLSVDGLVELLKLFLGLAEEGPERLLALLGELGAGEQEAISRARALYSPQCHSQLLRQLVQLVLLPLPTLMRSLLPSGQTSVARARRTTTTRSVRLIS